MVRRVIGILGVVVGLIILALTVSGRMEHAEPSRGYLVGGVLVVFGLLRIARSYGAYGLR